MVHFFAQAKEWSKTFYFHANMRHTDQITDVYYEKANVDWTLY